MTFAKRQKDKALSDHSDKTPENCRGSVKHRRSKKYTVSTKAEEGPQTSDFRLQISDFRLQPSDFRLQT